MLVPADVVAHEVYAQLSTPLMWRFLQEVPRREDAWAAAVGRSRLHVMVYEQVRADPQAAVDGVWRLVGLDPVPLAEVGRESSSSSTAEWEWTPGLRETLEVLYAPQVRRLADDWGLDVSSWRSFG